MNYKFKTIVTVTVFAIYLVSAVVFFSVFSGFYQKSMEKKFADENQYSAKTAKEYLDKEVNYLVSLARQIGYNPIVQIAMRTGRYISIDGFLDEKALKIEHENKFVYTKMAMNLKKGFFGNNEGWIKRDIEIYNRNLELLGNTMSSVQNDGREYDYINDIIKNGVSVGAETGTINIEKGEYIIKGMSSIRSYSNIYGVAVIREKLDSIILEEIKKTVNREVVFFDGDNIISSTIYVDGKRVENIMKKNIEKMSNDSFKVKLGGQELLVHYFPISDYNKKVIGYLGVGFDYSVIKAAYKKSLEYFIAFTLIFSVLLFVIMYFIMKKLFSPFNSIMNGINNISHGKYDAKIQFKGKGELKMLADNINVLSGAVKEREEELKHSKHFVSNLLENAVEGFITFGDTLLIDEGYSKESVNMLEEELAGKKVVDVLYGDDAKQSVFVESILKKILAEPDKKDLYIPLLPQIKEMKGKHGIISRTLKLDFKLIEISNDLKIMLVVSDITDTVIFKNQMEREKTVLKMVVNAFLQKKSLIALIDSYKHFATKEIRELIDKIDDVETLGIETFRKIHSFKGNFSTVYFSNTVDNIQDFEDELREKIKTFKNITESEFKNYLYKTDVLVFIEEDMKLLEDVLGHEYFVKKDEIILSKDALIDMDKKVVTGKDILYEIRRLSSKPIKTVLSPYISFMQDSTRIDGKSIEPIEVEADEILVDDEKSDVIKMIIGVLKNICDYEIESPEERLEKGKVPKGKIKLQIKKAGENIRIVFENDGSGVDFNRIRKTLIERNSISAEKISEMDDGEILNLAVLDYINNDNIIFNNGEEELANIKNDIEKRGGTFTISTEVNKGSVYTILYKYEDSSVDIVSSEEVIEAFADSATEFFRENTQINILNRSEVKVENVLELNKVTAFINITGALEGEIVISAEEGLALNLVEHIIVADITESEQKEYMGEVLAEIINIIVGGSLKQFKGVEELVTIDYPSIIFSEKTVMKYPGKEIWSCEIETEFGKVDFSFITEVQS